MKVREILKIFIKEGNVPDGIIDESEQNSRSKFLETIVRSGIIISEKFDAEQNCTVIYAVTYENLRMYVENYRGDWSSIPQKLTAPRIDARHVEYIRYLDVVDPGICLAENNGAFFWNDRFVFKCKGNPLKGEKNIEKRKDQARKAAILISQNEIINRFYKAKNIYSDQTIEYHDKLQVFYKELSETVKSGRVISENFYGEQNCIILFQVVRRDFFGWIEQPL